MKRFKVKARAQIEVGIEIVVEAEHADEAVEKAEELSANLMIDEPEADIDCDEVDFRFVVKIEEMPPLAPIPYKPEKLPPS